MKIFPIKILSPMDKMNNLITIINGVEKNTDYGKEVEHLNSKKELQELRNLCRTCTKQLRKDKFEKS